MKELRRRGRRNGSDFANRPYPHLEHPVGYIIPSAIHEALVL